MSRAVVIEPGKIPVIREIEGFEEARKTIGGHVERIRMGKFDCLCDEDGRMKGLPVNRPINGGQMIVGTFIVTKLGDDDLLPLTETEASWLVHDFALPAHED
jgi:hypothetical protein